MHMKKIFLLHVDLERFQKKIYLSKKFGLIVLSVNYSQFVMK